jgi:hypothetical protein
LFLTVVAIYTTDVLKNWQMAHVKADFNSKLFFINA